MSELNLLYVHAGWIGYGRVGVNLAEQLEQMGITVYDHLEGSEDHYGIAHAAAMPGNIDGRKNGRSNVACWVSVPSHGTGWYEGQVPVVFTMWEGMRLPETFRESLHEFDTCIVPCQANVELFSQYHDNVKLVPLGIDPIKWAYSERQQPETEFRFLCGGSGKRKGNDLVVKAFKRLWGKGDWPKDGPVPKLILKSPKGEAFYGDRIETVGGYLSPDEEVELYARAHCYVQPSRGEGFGLQPLQAIAQGCPTILTDGHGQADYAHLGLGLDWKPSQSDYFIFGDAGNWWEPDFDQLCDYMRAVYDNYDLYQTQAAANSYLARLDWTWRKTAEKFVEAIGPDKLGPYTGNGEWHKVEQKFYRVVTNRDHYHEVAGRAYSYKRGVEAWVPADIKRILYEARYLTAECIEEDDNGLSEEQMEMFKSRRAEFENCPTCHRPLQ